MVSTIERLQSVISSASSRYTRLVLLCGDASTGKSEVLRQLGVVSGASVLNVSLELARTLLDVPTRQRPVAAADRAADLIRASQRSWASILDNLELLFLPELQMDPLKLLQDSARNGVVVASWPGAREGEGLMYAHPSHPEYRRYDAPDCVVVEA